MAQKQEEVERTLAAARLVRQMREELMYASPPSALPAAKRVKTEEEGEDAALGSE